MVSKYFCQAIHAVLKPERLSRMQLYMQRMQRIVISGYLILDTLRMHRNAKPLTRRQSGRFRCLNCIGCEFQSGIIFRGVAVPSAVGPICGAQVILASSPFTAKCTTGNNRTSNLCTK